MQKKRLVGQCEEPNLQRGSETLLTDKDEVIGIALRTHDNVKPIFISVGHLINLDMAKQIILDCGEGYRLPEPTRQADKLVAREK